MGKAIVKEQIKKPAKTQTSKQDGILV